MGKKRKKGGKKREASRAYEAALQTPQRRNPIGAAGSQDAQVDRAIDRVRDWGRYLDENHDVASGVLDELVKGAIGTGIVTLPKPLRSDGSVDEVLSGEINRPWKKWCKYADVTGELPWNEAQRLIGRGWFRDGEYFAQHVVGRDRYTVDQMQTPYRIELLESEMVPWELTTDDGWRQGVRQDSWKRPQEYAVYLRHPGDQVRGFFGAPVMVSMDDVKTVFANSMIHIKYVKRWPSTRGMSVFSDVISRLYDIKDLEESERIKNRILASWTAAIIKSPDLIGHDNVDSNGDRYIEMAGGTVIDTLAAGESITGVGPDYPVASMPDHIADQMRRVASGTGTRYSSIAKRYDGSYSAARQELVETEAHYQIRTDQFVQKVVRSVYERWLLAAIGDGQVAVPSGSDLELISNAEFLGPVTPWIDPEKEVKADALAVAEGFRSIDQARIKHGAPPEMIGTPAPRAPAPAQLSLIPNGDEQEEDEEEAA